MNAIPSPDPPIVPTKLAHFVVRAKRFTEMLAWYRTVFQARTVFANDMIAFLSYDDEHHRIALVNTAHLPSPTQLSTGVDHIAFTYGSLADLLTTHARLKALGIKPYWCINHGPTTSMYYHDPERNGLEFQVENFATLEEARRFFESPAFKANPIGVDFDPELLRKKLLEGVPLADLLLQGAAPVEPGKTFDASALMGAPPDNNSTTQDHRNSL